MSPNTLAASALCLLVCLSTFAVASAAPDTAALLDDSGAAPHLSKAKEDADRFLAAQGVAGQVAAAAAAVGYRLEPPSFDPSGAAADVLLAAAEEAHALQTEALAGMTPQAWQLARAGALAAEEALVVDRDNLEAGIQVEPQALQAALEGLEALDPIDQEQMWQATYTVASGVDAALARIQAGSVVSGPAPRVATVTPTPLGDVWLDVLCTGTAADNTLYTTAYLLVIDLCGSDTYDAPAGGASPAQLISITIDTDQGDTVVADTTNPAKGGAVMGGISVALDTEGNDVRGAVGFSDTRLSGAGELAGFGLLMDLEGDDAYFGGTVGVPDNGGGTYDGVGILVDLAGDDVYSGDEHEQGSGWFGGLGVLVDRLGNDDYYDLSTFSQGSGGFPGTGGVYGIGLLVDGFGNDAYETPSAFEQGSGVCGGVGVLVDLSGHDTFEAPVFSQGFGGDAECPTGNGTGNALGVGVLLSLGGNDDYDGGFNSYLQGAHFGAGIGILADIGGDDKYKADNCSQGYGNAAGVSGHGGCGGTKLGLGLLLDCGGNDQYQLGAAGANVDGQGTGYSSLGLFLELTGTDTYLGGTVPPVPPSANNVFFARPTGDMGLFFDQNAVPCPTIISPVTGGGGGNGTSGGVGVGGFVAPPAPSFPAGVALAVAAVALVAVAAFRRRA